MVSSSRITFFSAGIISLVPPPSISPQTNIESNFFLLYGHSFEFAVKCAVSPYLNCVFLPFFEHFLSGMVAVAELPISKPSPDTHSFVLFLYRSCRSIVSYLYALALFTTCLLFCFFHLFLVVSTQVKWSEKYLVYGTPRLKKTSVQYLCNP